MTATAVARATLPALPGPGVRATRPNLAMPLCAPEVSR